MRKSVAFIGLATMAGMLAVAAGCGDSAAGKSCADSEAVGTACGAGVGQCFQYGTMECPEGAGDPVCNAVAGTPVDEICDGLDNDCDGETDNALPLEPAQNQKGICEGALKVCSGEAAWSEPDYGQLPGYEPDELSCDGKDNDCDGDTDEDFDLGAECSAGAGECAAAGVVVCAPDAQSTTCDAAPGQPADEDCDGLDNDCDGETDEDPPAPGLVECSSKGVCASGVKAVCTDAGWTCMYSEKNGYEATEVSCDGFDNDCDGETDENYDVGAECKAGTGQCEAAGVTVCAKDHMSTTCGAEPGQPAPETCDGEDNDCDGLADEFGVCGAGSCDGVKAGTVKCSYVPGDSSTSPAMDVQGRIYLTASETGFPKLHSIDPATCAGAWVYVSPEEGWFRSPSVGPDGLVHVGLTSMYSDIPSKLFAFDGDGVQQWALPMTDAYVSLTDLAIGTDGTIYFGDGYAGGGFYAVTAGGTLKWKLSVGGSEFKGAPAIGLDGTIFSATWKFFQGPPAAVYAISDGGDAGKIKWQFAPGGGDFSVSHAPAIGANGTVYIGLFLPAEGRTVIYALSPDTGAELWNHPLEQSAGANSAVVVGADDTIYVKSANGLIYAMSFGGTQKWAPFDTADIGWWGAPALGADGTLYVGSKDGFFSLSADDGAAGWTTAIEGAAGNPTIASNGIVWVSTASGLYAICSDSPGLADAPWPKSQHDERNTGSAKGL